MKLRPFRKVFPIIGERVFIDNSSVIIGDVKLGDNVSIWPLVAIRGDVQSVRIGTRTNVQEGSVLHVSRKSSQTPEGYSLTIGDDVTVGHKAMLHGCTIGNRVLIGMGSIVLDGAVIEDEVLLGAGSLVPPGKTLEKGFLYHGSPAKKARPLSIEEIKSLRESALNYVILKNEYLQEL